MPATPQQGRVSDAVQNIKILGIIAGGGSLPAKLAHACDKAGIDSFIVAFEGQTDPLLYQGRSHMLARLGAAGQIIQTLRAHGVQDLVMIGCIKRPGLSDLRPDLRTAKFLTRLGMRALGDDSLLSAIRYELEQEGFVLHGIQAFLEDLLMPEGVLGKHHPDQTDQKDIEKGIEASQLIGTLDIGQSVIIEEGTVLAVEGAEGTDALIARSAILKKKKENSGVLVKTCKPQQDRALDLPTIGPETVKACVDAGLKGIAVQAGAALLVDLDEVVSLANANGLFVTGIEIPV